VAETRPGPPLGNDRPPSRPGFFSFGGVFFVVLFGLFSCGCFFLWFFVVGLFFVCFVFGLFFVLCFFCFFSFFLGGGVLVFVGGGFCLFFLVLVGFGFFFWGK